MSITLSSAPSVEPLSLSDAKTHLRVTHTDEDDYITALIALARKDRENYTKRKFITQTWIYKIDDFPRNDDSILKFPFPPLQSVTSIQYIDTNGDTQTWSSSLYQVYTSMEPGGVRPIYAGQYPTVRDIQEAVTITFVCGFGDSASDVPDELRHAIKLMISHWYENRDEIVEGKTYDVPKMADYLSFPYGDWRF